MLKSVEQLKGRFAIAPAALALVCALALASALGGCAAEEKAADANGSQPVGQEQPADQGQEPSGPDDSAVAGADKLTVNVSVMSTTDDGAALFQEDMAVDEGTTALGVLKITGLNVKVEESDYGPYVTAIGEVEAEGNSGWTYTINGESPTVGANEMVLKAGDKVVWEFVTF